MTKIVVMHSGYGCDTGCCGHVIQYEDGTEVRDTFSFDHPDIEDHRAYAEQFVREQMGEEHVADLDWENCWILDD